MMSIDQMLDAEKLTPVERKFLCEINMNTLYAAKSGSTAYGKLRKLLSAGFVTELKMTDPKSTTLCCELSKQGSEAMREYVKQHPDECYWKE
jgi:hypothetical protein